MEQIAFVTGADRGLGFALCAGLVAQGWPVLAGQYMPDWPELTELAARYPDQMHMIPLNVADDDSVRAAAQMSATLVDHVDVLINNAGVIASTLCGTIREPQNYQDMQWQYNINTLGPLRVVEAFLPLTDRGALKRLCFVSSDASSIERCGHTDWYGYCMSKAALNMAIKILFNHLRLAGYTFRLYHPGWMRSYMHGQKNLEAHFEPEEAAKPALAYFLGPPSEAQAYDENQLALRDWQSQTWPW
jgi:NAD(P)-dependent dehydrogenase (short-subunit alcohol dehydrogenase family)